MPGRLLAPSPAPSRSLSRPFSHLHPSITGQEAAQAQTEGEAEATAAGAQRPTRLRAPSKRARDAEAEKRDVEAEQPPPRGQGESRPRKRKVVQASTGQAAAPPPLTKVEALQAASDEKLTLRVSNKNTTGYIGVYPHGLKYAARQDRDGKKETLGSFATAEEAALQIARSAAQDPAPPPLTKAEVLQAAVDEKLTLRMSTKSNTGYFGVALNKPGQPKPYQAQLRRDGKMVGLGCFTTAEETALRVAQEAAFGKVQATLDLMVTEAKAADEAGRSWSLMQGLTVLRDGLGWNLAQIPHGRTLSVARLLLSLKPKKCDISMLEYHSTTPTLSKCIQQSVSVLLTEAQLGYRPPSSAWRPSPSVAFLEEPSRQWLDFMQELEPFCDGGQKTLPVIDFSFLLRNFSSFPLSLFPLFFFFLFLFFSSLCLMALAPVAF